MCARPFRHWLGLRRRSRQVPPGQRQRRCRRQSMVTIADRRRTHPLSRQKIDRWWSSTGPGLSKQPSRRYSTPPPPHLMRSSMSAAGSTWSVPRRDTHMVAAAASSSTYRTTCVRWAQSVSAVAARSDVRSTNPCRHGTPAVSMMWPGANSAVPHSSKASFPDCATWWVWSGRPPLPMGRFYLKSVTVDFRAMKLRVRI